MRNENWATELVHWTITQILNCLILIPTKSSIYHGSSLTVYIIKELPWYLAIHLVLKSNIYQWVNDIWINLKKQYTHKNERATTTTITTATITLTIAPQKVYVYKFLYVCICMFVHLHVRIHNVHMYQCMYTYSIYIRYRCVWIYACIYICIHTFIYLCRMNLDDLFGPAHRSINIRLYLVSSYQVKKKKKISQNKSNRIKFKSRLIISIIYDMRHPLYCCYSVCNYVNYAIIWAINCFPS